MQQLEDQVELEVVLVVFLVNWQEQQEILHP
jgi:hypothetical protein